MRIDIFTLFPAMFSGPLDESIIQRARSAGLVEIAIHDLRTWTTDRHRTADDTPYGGGAGMVMMAPPIVTGVEAVLGEALATTPVLVTAAGGAPFTQVMARELAGAPRLAIICGHYEGIDARVTALLGAREVAIGDYVLTGGELPAMVIADAVTRLLPGVIDQASIQDESHEQGLLEYPHYTRPATYRELAVPEILFSGHHAKIAAWRRAAAIRRTATVRPDLLARAPLTPEERRLALESAGDLGGGAGVPQRAPDAETGEVPLGEVP